MKEDSYQTFALDANTLARWDMGGNDFYSLPDNQATAPSRVWQSHVLGNGRLGHLPVD